MGALLKLSSPAGAVNQVMQEVALDCSEGEYGIEIVSHIPGILNVWADSLSRLEAPGAEKKEVPFALHSVPRTSVGPRTRSWWRTLRPGPAELDSAAST